MQIEEIEQLKVHERHRFTYGVSLFLTKSDSRTQKSEPISCHSSLPVPPALPLLPLAVTQFSGGGVRVERNQGYDMS